MKIEFVKEPDLTESQKEDIVKLAKECFGDVPQKEIEEDFIAESFGRLLTYEDDQLIGMSCLFKRVTEFDGENIVYGGVGGVCVTGSYRGKGIATKMIEQGLAMLRKEGCDVACLNVDRRKTTHKIYEKVGFKFLGRDISYEDINGVIKYDGDSMFMPLNSPEKFQKIMKNEAVFHQGRGYW